MQKIVSSKPFKIFFWVILLLAAISLNPVFSADFFRTDPDIAGKIIDFDTQKPIAGVVVTAMWTTDVFRLTIEPDEKYYDYFETLSDKNGEFRIPGKGLTLFRNINPPKIKIFKTGYAAMYLKDLGPHFKQDSRFRSQVEWMDGKPVISFKKKTVEERKKSIHEHRSIPFYGMGKAGVPPEKYRLYTEEVTREYHALGKTPYWEQNPQYLEYKKGGVYPAGATAAEPRKN